MKVAGDTIEWNMIPYEVQLVGAMALHQGKVAEMKPVKENLVSIFPAYLNALAGKGVHVITVNNYLAKRDAEWNGQYLIFMGSKLIVSIDMNPTPNNVDRLIGRYNLWHKQ